MAYDIYQVWFVAQTQNEKFAGSKDDFSLTLVIPGDDIVLRRSEANSKGEFNQELLDGMATEFYWSNIPAGTLTTDNITNVKLQPNGSDAWGIRSIFVMGRYYDADGNSQLYLIAANPSGNFCLSSDPSDCDGTAQQTKYISLRPCPN